MAQASPTRLSFQLVPGVPVGKCAANVCPKCGSLHIKEFKTKKTWTCTFCGAWFLMPEMDLFDDPAPRLMSCPTQEQLDLIELDKKDS